MVRSTKAFSLPELMVTLVVSGLLAVLMDLSAVPLLVVAVAVRATVGTRFRLERVLPRLDRRAQPRHDAAAQNPIELADSGRETRGDHGVHVGVPQGPAPTKGRSSASTFRSLVRLLDRLFDERIPGTTIRAAAQPLR